MRLRQAHQDEMDMLTTQHEEELKEANKRLREALIKCNAEKQERSKAQKLLTNAEREMGLFEGGERQLRISEAVGRLLEGLKDSRERVQELEKALAAAKDLPGSAASRRRLQHGDGSDAVALFPPPFRRARFGACKHAVYPCSVYRDDVL